MSFAVHSPRASASWPDVIARSLEDYKRRDRPAWDKNLKHFLGDAWAATTVGESEAELIKTSTNFVLPLVETAQANISPPNPRVTLNPRSPANRDQIEQGTTIVNYMLQQGKWRWEANMAIYHVVMCGRGPVKTTWDFDRDLAVSRFLDPRNYFFDRTAQRFEDMKYEIEATLLTKRQMERKIEEGVYPSWALERGQAQYPDWIAPAESKALAGIKNYQTWYPVYEVYDREAGVVFHYLLDVREPLMEDALVYRPYDLLTFTYNGTDCGGVSEVGLIMANLENYNWTETFELNRLRNDIPVDYYDARLTSTDKEAKKLQAPLGAKVPVKPPDNRTIAESIYRPPPVAPHPLAQDNLAKMREAMGYVSAMSDSQRAQTIGAKTATEMEWIKQQIRDRLGPRIAAVDELTAAVAAKQFFLAQRYMREEKVVQLVGEKEWRTVNPFTIEGVEATFDIVPYNPMRMNAAVRIEALRNLQPLIQNNPWVKQRAVAAAIFKDVQLGNDESEFLYTPEEFAQMQAAQQAAQPASPAVDPGAPAPSPATPLDSAPAPADPGGMPPGGPLT